MTECSDEFIGDIEDLISSEDLPPRTQSKSSKDVVANSSHEEFVAFEGISQHKPNGNPYESVIPGSQTIFLKTWGCAHNNSDSEYMAGQLVSSGYKITNNKEEADLWLLNSCTVKNPSEDTFRNDIQAGLKKGKYVVVAGCVSQGAPKSKYLNGLSVVGVQQIDRVVEVVEETLKGHSVRLLRNKKANGKRLAGAKLSLPKIRKNPLIEIIAINTGCLNECTYCKTKHARGNLASYTPDEIVDRAKQAFEEGCCEVWLTSEDTGAYGKDIGTSLPQLLWKLVEVIPEFCMMRVGMTNPPYILEQLEEISKILNHPRVYSFLHIPVQSGSDNVLGEMRREYCRKDFEHVVDFLLKNVFNLTIATDIICGFPTESEEDFEETMSLCSKYKFPSLFINQFYPRPGTPAAKMKLIPANMVKQRTKRLTELFNSYEPYANRVGQIYNVLVTEISHDKKYYVAHNKSYEQVLVPMRPNLLGTLVRVQIIETSKFSMKGKILDDEKEWTKCSTKTRKDVTTSRAFISNMSISLLNKHMDYIGLALVMLFCIFAAQMLKKIL